MRRLTVALLIAMLVVSGPVLACAVEKTLSDSG